MKMNPIQACFLGVFLCFVALKISSADTVREGDCPPERCYNASIIDIFLTCKDDTECRENEKCCTDNGSKICKPIAKKKEGSCPIYCPKDPKPCQDMCSCDSECAGDSKCCMTDQGKSCMPKIEPKKGTCPGEPLMCFRGARMFCRDDTDCQDNKKCCPFKCGKMCETPL